MDIHIGRKYLQQLIKEYYDTKELPIIEERELVSAIHYARLSLQCRDQLVVTTGNKVRAIIQEHNQRIKDIPYLDSFPLHT